MPQPEPPIWKIGIATSETSSVDHLFQSGVLAARRRAPASGSWRAISIAPLGLPVVPEV